MTEQVLTLRHGFERYHRSSEHKARTKADYETAVGHWERLTDNPDLRTVDNLFVRDFKERLLATPLPDGRPITAQTAAKILRELQAIFCTLGPQSLRNKRGLDVLPNILCCPVVRTYDAPVVVASDEEIKAILEARKVATWPRRVIDERSLRVIEFEPPDWWLNLILYLGTFGSRRNEFLELECADFDLVGRKLMLEPEKNGDRNFKPIPHDLVPYFLGFMSPPRQYFFAIPNNSKALYDTWHKIQEEAGIKVRRARDSRRKMWYGFHEMRKTCGTNWAAVNSAAGQHMLGHRSREVFDRAYTNKSRVTERVLSQFQSPTSLLTPEAPPPDRTPPGGQQLRVWAG